MFIDENYIAGGMERSYLEAEDYLEEEERTDEYTYWLFDEPEIPNMVNRAGDFLQDMQEKYNVRPAIIDDEERIFEMRYEIAKYGENLTFTEAIIESEAVAFLDFSSGIPFNAVEMKPIIYELSTEKMEHLYPVIAETGAAAPVPTDFFDEDYHDILFNYLYLDADNVDGFIEGLSGETETFLWWTRKNMVLPDENEEPQKYPTPGEFVALGIRMFPDKPWGDQESSPYLFSGNWFDTLYYTTAVVEEIEEPTNERPFPLYRVAWRGKEEERLMEDYNKFWARPSGFETYAVDDRVTVIKDVDTERKTQTWKDDQEFQEIIWRLAPITFYEYEDT